MRRLFDMFRLEHILYLTIPLLLLATSLTGIAQQNENKEIICRLSGELVVLAVTVTDPNGHPVKNLTSDNFFVTDSNKPQEIDFFSCEVGPRSVGIVLCGSRATRSEWVTSLLQHIRSFKEQSHEMNEYFITVGSGPADVVTDWTRDSDALIAGLCNAASRDATSGDALYDSCASAQKKCDERETLRSVILLISDGQDDSSQWSYADLHESFMRSATLVYSIRLVDHRKLQGSQKDLKKLASASGGDSYVVSSANELAQILSRIAVELRHQYLIGYFPSRFLRDGAWHSVEVMAHSQTDGSADSVPMEVRTGSGYNAPNETVLLQKH